MCILGFGSIKNLNTRDNAVALANAIAALVFLEVRQYLLLEPLTAQCLLGCQEVIRFLCNILQKIIFLLNL